MSDSLLGKEIQQYWGIVESGSQGPCPEEQKNISALAFSTDVFLSPNGEQTDAESVHRRLLASLRESIGIGRNSG